jgi:hypothetical protein
MLGRNCSALALKLTGATQLGSTERLEGVNSRSLSANLCCNQVELFLEEGSE